AKSCGSDYVVNVKNTANVKDEAMKMTSGKGIDVVIDCVGAENTVSDSIRLLAKGGAIIVVGLFGNLFKVPVAPLVLNEYKISGSLWGSYNELREVVELQKQGKIRNNIRKFKLDEINQAIDLLKQGQIVGRGVIIP
ncbi:MAG: zinc-binding dehydrogenase, partial [Candidatus Nitrosocosmicus sp.]